MGMGVVLKSGRRDGLQLPVGERQHLSQLSAHPYRAGMSVDLPTSGYSRWKVPKKLVTEWKAART